MGREKSPGRRFCEECGRLIESKRPGVTLCHVCEKKVLEEYQDEDDRERRRGRRYARDVEDQLFGLGSDSRGHDQRKDRRRPA